MPLWPSVTSGPPERTVYRIIKILEYLLDPGRGIAYEGFLRKSEPWKPASSKTYAAKRRPRRIFDQIRTAILEGRLKPRRQAAGGAGTDHLFRCQPTRPSARPCAPLEILGLLDIRAGSGGGAFVSAVDLDTTKASLANFLCFQNLSIGHLSEIRKALEPFAVRLAIERMGPGGHGGIAPDS